MKKPHFLVLGQRVPIIKEKNPPDHHPGFVGWFDPSDRTIHMLEHEAKEGFEKTLAHEGAHAVMCRVGLDQVIPGELQELLCEAMSHFVTENYSRLKSPIQPTNQKHYKLPSALSQSARLVRPGLGRKTRSDRF